MKPVQLGVLQNCIKNYEWGSRTAIAELQGRPTPSAEPEAELWMGAHPAGPSRVNATPQPCSLLELTRTYPGEMLGPGVTQFGPRLPFLLKVLAADRPLSIQVHPNAEQAEARFHDEGRAGVPIDAPERNYKDPYHKPELLCALSRFEALSGFRELADIERLAGRLAIAPLCARVRTAACSPQSLQQLFVDLIQASPRDRRELISAALAARPASGVAADGDARLLAWVQRLARQYPDDAGVLAPLILNHVVLEPGEALYAPAGVLHAYLSGVGVEIMASSDNVLRGGLTRKRVDVPELLRTVHFASSSASKLLPEQRGQEAVYRTEASEFRLSRITLEPPQGLRVRGGRPEILLCVEGEALLAAAGTELTLARGQAAFVAASCDQFELRGTAALFRATTSLAGRTAQRE
jgi:mannose-6-phosphate isomerase